MAASPEEGLRLHYEGDAGWMRILTRKPMASGFQLGLRRGG
ncbi:MAG: hypothetical protein U0798_13000 [Gemmataceae bacterium]